MRRPLPDQADVLVLRLVSGLTVEAVAGVLAKTPGAVKALQRRGLCALRKVGARGRTPVSRQSDFSNEMPGDLPPLDDALAPFAEEVRFAVSGPPPVPTRALASVLAGGFSTPSEKGDLLVTAASNVHGPARQAAGLPKWKEEKDSRSA